MNHDRIRILTVTLAALVFAASPLTAQRGSGSLDAASPEIAALGVEPGEIAAFDEACSLVSVWSDAELGLAPGDELDAFSDTNNTIPFGGPAAGLPGSLVVVAFSVDRTAAGAPGSAVLAESSTDGAASDVFEQRWFSGVPAGVVVTEDATCLTPTGSGRTQSDVDAINQSVSERYPVFLSLDPATAAARGFSPADLLMIPEPGAPLTLALSEAALGLVPGDDIDALAVGKPGGLVFSLTAGSPTALAAPAMGGAGLWTLIPDPAGPGLFAPTPWALPADVELLASDELNAVTIGDPRVQHHGGFDPGKSWMCCDPNTGASDQTGVWRVFDLRDRQHPFAVQGVEVGVNQVQGYDFPITVNLYAASTADPQGAKTLLASDTLVYAQGTAPGTTFVHRFDDVDTGNEFLWVEMSIPASPGFPNDGAFWWAGTGGESAPTYVDAPGCGWNMADLDQIGAPDVAVQMTLWGNEQAPVDLLHGMLIPGQPAEFLALGAQPGEPVHFGYGLGGIGAGPCPPALGGLCLDLLPPVGLLAPPVVADPLGVARLQIPVPPAPAGLELFTQAVILRGTGGADSVKSQPQHGRLP